MKSDSASSELKQLLEDKLEESALTLEHAKALGMVLMDGIKAKDSLGVALAVGGVKIPYFNTDGTQTKFWRYRYLEPTLNGFAKITDKKPMRYTQPRGTVPELYLPPLVDWAKIKDDVTISIVITEGELKAACACSKGIPTIGLGGVWCFKSNRTGATLIEQFKEFVWTGRRVYICYDSDATTNPMVLQAENALAQELLQLGSVPHIIRLPQLVPPAKTGVDDFIVSEGTKIFEELLVFTDPWRTAKALYALNELVVYVRDPGIILDVNSLQKHQVGQFRDHAFSTYKWTEERETARGTRFVEHSAPVEWLKWKYRSEVKKMTYAPNKPRIIGETELNLWDSWGCLPAEGDISPWKELLDYVFFEEDHNRLWFEKWLAYPLQHPGTKLLSAVLIWGTEQGTGKTLIGHTMAKIYGKNYGEIGVQELNGAFNGWAENKQFIMGEEITGGDNRVNADRMKTMITQSFVNINQKYLPAYSVPDCINYYFTSNHPDAFFIEDSDRRFFVHELNRPPLPRKFYQKYDGWLKGTGPQYLFDYLLKLDVHDFNPKECAPMTRSKRSMIDHGRSDIGNWVAQLRESPDTTLIVAGKPMGYCLFTASELHSIYDSRSPGKTTVNGMARELSKANFDRVNKGQPVPTDHGPQRLWVVRPIKDHEKLGSVDLAELYRQERGVVCKLTTKF